ncbi:phosphodiesterase, MJ0936 family protein [Natrinema pellirubrum DSM 15624]|uniref:Phosphoesterase n=1 Tax=Natrinema pellirubrum (strain DSM 15624 / CIP 106293 / JCM 10476 / NCIMB 786 / 157) TaxID=797303 RepID=L0JHZ8_NATP1|nr:YfcE family phosphodiesterase [Natrinema pellirubrum]AGB30192.1 phosphoesterase, MJ0936 family [Natrinema pellirubrum DSM 15624]ELY78481.1 phosphodiesterase, MJ0936 family protein [Natrinema pellirubrum DSM 15624]
MTRIAIVSDTHVPTREPELPAWVVTEIAAADHTIHAGDFESFGAYERIVDRTDGELTAVLGNVDPATLDVPKTATLEVDGVRFVVTHGDGSSGSWRERVVETARENADATADTNLVAVAGHTHAVVDETVAFDESRPADGGRAAGHIRLLNPGSATGAAPTTHETMFVATVVDGDVTVELRTGEGEGSATRA